ncbi:MAG: tRNA pseudouridine(55) synthase TruB [Thermoflexales bacterium]|nr:tRNA pseudouridine(55) synthase TruB [Thermoflexales bacterium]
MANGEWRMGRGRCARMLPVDGVLVLDKPVGPSSHDMVALARRLLHQRQVGHAGTLDPLASGVLVLCLGKATRLSEYLLGEDKAYEAVLRLGQRTTTDDAEGEVVVERPVPAITAADLRALEARFSGTIEQVPPAFSAVKRAGQRAYALARQGQPVALSPRQVTIRELHLAHGDAPDQLRLWMRCSAGTYVRALARDLGEVLGCGAHLVALRRTQSGAFTLADAVTPTQLEAVARAGNAAALVLPPERALEGWQAVHLDAERSRRLCQGQRLRLVLALAPGALVRVHSASGALIAVAEWDGEGLRPLKVLETHP